MDHATRQAMTRYATGDDSAFDLLHSLVSPALAAFARRLAARGDHTADLLQRTFLQLHRHRSRYRVGAPVLPWVFAIARRLWIDEQRRAAREAPARSVSVEGVASAFALDEQVCARQLGRRLQRSLAALPPHQAEAFLLVSVQGLSYAEAAALASTTVAAIKLRLFRANSTLRAALSRATSEPPVARAEEALGPLCP